MDCACVRTSSWSKGPLLKSTLIHDVSRSLTLAQSQRVQETSPPACHLLIEVKSATDILNADANNDPLLHSIVALFSLYHTNQPTTIILRHGNNQSTHTRSQAATLHAIPSKAVNPTYQQVLPSTTGIPLPLKCSQHSHLLPSCVASLTHSTDTSHLSRLSPPKTPHPSCCRAFTKASPPPPPLKNSWQLCSQNGIPHALQYFHFSMNNSIYPNQRVKMAIHTCICCKSY